MIPTLDVLKNINSDVNKLPYTPDIELYKLPEFWARISDKGTGDCEDFALEKYFRLLDLNTDLKCLRLATCWCETREYHAVLLVDINNTTYVLDNRYPYPMEYTMLNYKWDKLQIAGSNKWELA